MKDFSKGLNGISADLLKSVAQVSAESRQKATEQAQQHKQGLTGRFESFRPVAADKIEKSPRAIERVYAGMAPAYKAEQKEETIAERVAALKVTTKHQPIAHDSVLIEPKITLKGGAKRKMEAESVEITDEDKAFIEQLNTSEIQVEEEAVEEGWDDMLKDVKRLKSLSGTGKFDVKKTSTGTVYTRKSSTFDDGGKDADLKKAEKKEKNEEVEQIHELSDAEVDKMYNALMKADGNRLSKKYSAEVKKSKDIESGKALEKHVKNNPGVVKTYSNAVKKDKKMYGEEAEQIEEKKLRDTPGQEHMCAVHVKHATLGEGKTLFSQHAEPDADGYIAWYDVMFEEGLARVNTKDLEILEACSHKNHKK